jgi:hypothetical protein
MAGTLSGIVAFRMARSPDRPVKLWDGLVPLLLLLSAAGVGAQTRSVTTKASTRPADPDLVGWWRAAGAGSAGVADASGTGRAARGKVVVESVDGRPALRITPATGALVVGDDPAFDFAADFSVCLRVKLSGEQSDVALLSKRGVNGVDGWAVVYAVRQTGGVGFVAAPGVVIPTPCKATEDWVHVAVTFHERQILVYVDGKAIGVRDLERVPTPSQQPLMFGGVTGGKGLMDGWLDDVRVYHRGLTAAEVETLAAGREPENPYRALTAAEQREVRRLVRELGAESFERRDRAAQELKAMGRRIFPALRTLRDSPDAEVSTRVRAILGELPKGEEGK